MQTFKLLVDWLAENESAISALAAILVISGIVYGALRFILGPILQRRAESKRTTYVLKSASASKKTIDPQTSLQTSNVSLAVTLFDSLSNNEEDQFLAAGITSEVIAYVTMVPNIRVSSRLSSYQFKSGRVDVQKVAKQLNTRYVLTGSMRHAGERIRVIVQLTDIKTDSEVWAQTYDRQIEDLFDVQQDIAKCIVGAVLGEVRLAETLFAGASPVHQLDAWGLVQKAYHFWLTSVTPEGISSACDYLRQAIEIEPDYANARAALAMILTNQMLLGLCEDYDAVAAEASDLVETAYQQAPNDIDVLENAGVAWQNLGDSRRSEMVLRRVVQMAPLNLTARGYLALLLAFTGGKSGALEARQIVIENFVTAPQHPSAPYWNFFLALAEQYLGNNTEAIELAKKSLIGQPGWVHNYFVIANAHCLAGDRDSAEVAIANANAINPYMNTQVYTLNLFRIVGGEKNATPFINGLKAEGLLD